MPVDPAFDFGANLRALRAAKHWNQAELASRAGVSRQTISSLENGSAKARTETGRKLADALGVPFWAVLGTGRGQQQPGPPWTIIPWPPDAITWTEVEIAIYEYMANRRRQLRERAERERRQDESVGEAEARIVAGWQRDREEMEKHGKSRGGSVKRFRDEAERTRRKGGSRRSEDQSASG